MTGRPGLILDRDGVVNVDTNYLYRIEDCRFMPGIFEVIQYFGDRGFAIAIATNQSGIGRGKYTEDDFHKLMGWMDRTCRRQTGYGFDAVYFCPHLPEAEIEAYRKVCDCRKPAPGMAMRAVAELGLDPARSWVVGDKMRDLDAGKGAGIANRVLLDIEADEPRREDDHWVISCLAELIPLSRVKA
jgi:D-glycero-D-manno-heptose 1,7-bisphosphate phosphatase